MTDEVRFVDEEEFFPVEETAAPIEGESSKTALLSFFFIFGTAAGVFVVSRLSGKEISLLFSVFEGFYEARTAENLLRDALLSFSVQGAFLALLFLSGFCAFGRFIPFLLLFFKGAGFGLTFSSAVLLSGLAPLPQILILAPFAALSALILSKGGSDAFQLSSCILAALRDEKRPDTPQHFPLRFLIYAVGLLVLSLGEAFSLVALLPWVQSLMP